MLASFPFRSVMIGGDGFLVIFSLSLAYNTKTDSSQPFYLTDRQTLTFAASDHVIPLLFV